MPWYKTGTVSVVQNSNAVIGTGTAFIANSRVGDGFRGPDGGWYEVVNIASDTALSISPNYQGASNAAGGYALAPLQGYVKDSADALRAIVNTYGTKLAALGTTGNYDILPPSKGGTGLTAVGTAVSANVTTSVTDTTPGRLLHVGDLGLGVRIDITGTDLNTLFTPGGYWHGAVPAAPNSAVANAAGYVDVSVAPLAGSTRYEQQWRQIGTNAIFRRVWSGSAWLPWEVVVMGGANSSITSLTGLTTALSVLQGGTGVTTLAALLAALQTVGAYSKANIVGTVSDLGGVPNGAAFESGTINGTRYVKLADGTLFQYKTVSIGGGTVANGSVFKSLAYDMGGLAVSPVGDWVVASFGISQASGGGWAGQQLFGAAGAWGTWSAYTSAAVTGTIIISLVGIGRWKV